MSLKFIPLDVVALQKLRKQESAFWRRPKKRKKKKAMPSRSIECSLARSRFHTLSLSTFPSCSFFPCSLTRQKSSGVSEKDKKNAHATQPRGWGTRLFFFSEKKVETRSCCEKKKTLGLLFYKKKGKETSKNLLVVSEMLLFLDVFLLCQKRKRERATMCAQISYKKEKEVSYFHAKNSSAAVAPSSSSSSSSSPVAAAAPLPLPPCRRQRLRQEER